jgi:2,3-bisphosphoglycerate-dependent phosphoglycerate mutase
MQLYFIRHAQSANNALWASTGASQGRSEDPELTDTGRRQAEALADFLRRAAESNVGDYDWRSTSGFHLTHLYSSLMVRAVSTGAVVARALDLRLEAWPDLHECGGVYLEQESSGQRVGQAGKTRSYFETGYPELLLPETLDEAGWWNRRPYEETLGRARRAERVWRTLLERHNGRDDRVAVITHGCFYNHLMSALLKFPWHQPDPIRHRLYHIRVRLRLARKRFFWFQLNNVGITRIDFRKRGAVLVYQNRVDYLPTELITD